MKQRSRSLFGFKFNGFCTIREPTEGVFGVHMAYNWQHGHGWVVWGSFEPYSSVFGGITGLNRGPEAFLGLILIVSVAPESQSKMCLALIWPTPGSIDIVGWPVGSFEPFQYHRNV